MCLKLRCDQVRGGGLLRLAGGFLVTRSGRIRRTFEKEPFSATCYASSSQPKNHAWVDAKTQPVKETFWRD
jgi:hypothetical protein